MAKSPGTARIVQDAQLYDELKQHPAWRRLHEHVEADEDRFFGTLSRRLMAGEDVSQREIDFHRGWYRACKWLLAHPEQAMDNLEKAAKSALLLMELELEQATEADSPYL